MAFLFIIVKIGALKQVGGQFFEKLDYSTTF
jgi:hypothetical protein